MAFSPVELAPSGKPEGFPPNGFNIAFRFGAEQASKLRACDDLRHGLTNEACAVLTPIQMVSWGHIAQLYRRSCDSSRDWALFKADREAAYKQFPLAPADQPRAIIALRRPKSHKWFGFTSRTLMFGASGAVLHYNVFSRMVTALANRLFGIPLICFFDVFSAFIPRLLVNKALQFFTTFCSLLGIRLKEGKLDVWPRITSLCLVGWFPGRQNGQTLHISLTDEKREARAALLRDYMRKGAIAHQELEKPIGRMSFSQTLLFGKFVRTQLRPLYQKLYRKVYNARLSEADLGVFGWWGRAIRSFSPTICRPCAQPCDWLVYTDAATTPPRLCALRFRGGTRTPNLVACSSMDAPSVWLYHFRETCLIFGLGLLALVDFLEDEADGLDGCSIWFYMGSNNSLSAMTRGDSNTASIAILVSRDSESIQRFQINAWFSRVPSKLNPADLPTRGKRPPFKSSKQNHFRSLADLYRRCRGSARVRIPSSHLRASREFKGPFGEDSHPSIWLRISRYFGVISPNSIDCALVYLCVYIVTVGILFLGQKAVFSKFPPQFFLGFWLSDQG